MIPTPEPAALRPPSGVRVLVVDDDPIVRRSLFRSLSSVGFEVATTPDVEIALEAAAANRPDIALVDLDMPVSGLELVRELKAQHGGAIHVAMLSAWSADDIQDRCIEAGADEFLLKTMSAAELRRHLIAAARRQNVFIEARLAREHADRMRTYGAEAASLLAHDLNNSLTAALMSLQYLGLVLRLDGDQQEALDSTRYSLERMSALVSNLVDVARFEDERLQAQLADVDVRELVDAVAATHRNRGAAVVIESEAGLRAAVDRPLIERVLHNLVGNAVRHCVADSEVRVRAVAWPQPDRAGGVEISVHNHGPQVAPELAERLFSKYARGREGRRGMGLYFCRLVCEAHGGSIALSADDDGPTFRVRLPGRVAIAF